MACERKGPTLEDAKGALEAGNFELAKKLAFDSKDPERFAFINFVDAKKRASEEFDSELAFTKAHAAEEGRAKTKATLERLVSKAPTTAQKEKAAAALRDFEEWFPKETAPEPVDPRIKRPERVEGTGGARKRTVDENPPEDGLKKRTGMEPTHSELRDLLTWVDAEVVAGRYRQALELLGMASGDWDDADRAALANAGAEIRARAKRDLAALRERAAGAVAILKTPPEIEATLEGLLTDLQNFPATGDAALLRKRVSGLLGKAFSKEEALANLDLSTAVARTVDEGAPIARPEPEPERAPEPPPATRLTFARFRGADVEEELRAAEEAFAAGDLAGAKARFLEVAGFATIPALKSEAAARAEECGRLTSIVERITAAAAADPSAFSGFQAGPGRTGALTAATGEGVVLTIDGVAESVPWAEVPASSIQACLRKLGTLPPDEKLAAASLLERARAVKDADRLLKEAVDGEPKLQAAVDLVLARRRGIEPPAYGFVWFRGEWVTFTERENAKLADRVRELLTRLESSGSSVEREAIRAEIGRLGSEATDALVMALRGRRAEMIAKLKSMNFAKKIAPLREERVKLDKARAHALELIFDEVTYFYPYNPPECPPEKAKLYPEVQKEVNHRVAAVRELWDSKTSVPLGSSAPVLRALQEAQIQLKELGAGDLALEADVEVCLAVDTTEPELTLRTFCVSARERSTIRDHNRRILAFNASNETSETPEDRRVLFLTNQYREMFGRRMLASNERLVQSARKHAKWMADSGTFSHFSSLPGLRTPFERMKAEGYAAGVSENIALAAGPDGAFQGWIHSSGHHRNILMEGHTELGCGGIGRYFVQNFGMGEEYRSSKAWRN